MVLCITNLAKIFNSFDYCSIEVFSIHTLVIELTTGTIA